MEAGRKTLEWELWEVAVRNLGDGARQGETGRDGAGRWQEGAGPELAGGPGPEAPAPAAEEKTEDDLQIHSEGRATERGAVSGWLSPPCLGRGSSRDPSLASPSLLSFPRARERK